MGRYQTLVGKRVEAHYRAGELQLSAAGILAVDSGESIFLEDRFVQGGKEKTLRVEIPYQYLLSLKEKTEQLSTPAPAKRSSHASPKHDPSSKS